MSSSELVTSPLIEVFESLGFDSAGNNGERSIESFSSPEDEINSLYNGVGLRDISDTAVIELRGKDVLDFLHRITTNDLKDLRKEETKETIFTSDKGRIIDLTTLMNFGDYYLLLCNRENKRKVISWIDKYVIADDVNAEDVTGKYIITEISGPQADSYMTLICGKVVNDIPVNCFKVIDSEGMLFFLSKTIDNRGEIKFRIIADHDNGKNLVKYMERNTGIFDFNLIGDKAYESFRIEQGIPAAPNELNDEYNPHESKLIEYVDFKKGCYIGQEVIARLETYEKVKQYLTGVRFDEEIDPSNNFELFDDEDKPAGKITSLVDSIRCKKYIGLAYIKKAYTEQGTLLNAKSENGELYKVEVRNLPFKK